ncbi:MAG TPA: GNAT family protein [Verrucomicrobiae bacterium]|nr:GNAT family protein [Verrucomicrobiae bacterium]
MNGAFDPQPVVLTGEVVRLEPLDLRHATGLLQAAADKTIWNYMPLSGFPDLAAVEGWIRESLAGADVVFAIVLKETGVAVGSTRYMDIRRAHRGLEIGFTWLAPGVQRTRVNTEAKYLLLKHAFEELGAVRVQLKTDARNTRSQRAIERIGGVMEGAHRRHMLTWDGHVRDTIYYSILDSEWPTAKRRLEAMLGLVTPAPEA